MSAFVVDPTHIDLILSCAVNGPRDGERHHLGEPWYPPYVNELLPGAGGPLRKEDGDRAGAALLAECIASVSHRYPGDDHLGLPGPVPTPRPEDYRWKDFGSALTIAEACSAIDCYEYQSCEHPGWDGSGAAAFCRRLRSGLTGALPGYDEAPWEWTAEIAAERQLEAERRRRVGYDPRAYCPECHAPAKAGSRNRISATHCEYECPDGHGFFCLREPVTADMDRGR
jgi:hypothetical protein